MLSGMWAAKSNAVLEKMFGTMEPLPRVTQNLNTVVYTTELDFLEPKKKKILCKDWQAMQSPGTLSWVVVFSHCGSLSKTFFSQPPKIEFKLQKGCNQHYLILSLPAPVIFLTHRMY